VSDHRRAHAQGAQVPARLTRAAQVIGLFGGLAWLVAAFLWDGGDDPVELGLFWAGAAMITLFLLELGTLLVKRGLLSENVAGFSCALCRITAEVAGSTCNSPWQQGQMTVIKPGFAIPRPF